MAPNCEVNVLYGYKFDRKNFTTENLDYIASLGLNVIQQTKNDRDVFIGVILGTMFSPEEEEGSLVLQVPNQTDVNMKFADAGLPAVPLRTYMLNFTAW